MLKRFLKIWVMACCLFLAAGQTGYVWADADTILGDAINANQIRVAGPELIRNWEQKRIELYGQAGIQIDSSDLTYMKNHSAFEILSPDFIIPTGLSGANSVDFYLPESLQIPEGDIGHSNLFMLADGNCIGHSGSGCVELRKDSLREAINKKQLRIARPEIMKRWAEKALELYTQAGIEVKEVHFRRPENSNAFEIISSDFIISDEFAGANSVSFYLPEQYLIPGGPLGHSSMYLLKDGTCIGHGRYCTDMRDIEFLRNALNDNYIAVVKPLTIKTWYEKHIDANSQNLNQKRIDALLRVLLDASHSYEVVSEKFVMSKLSGANSIRLFVPENFNKPNGDFGHSSAFLLKDGSCTGSDITVCVGQ